MADFTHAEHNRALDPFVFYFADGSEKMDTVRFSNVQQAIDIVCNDRKFSARFLSELEKELTRLNLINYRG